MMPSPDSNSHATASNMLPDNDDDYTKASVAELREDLASILSEFKNIVAERTANASAASADVVADGLESTRGAIRSNPLAGVMVAALAGAAIAALVVPAPRRTISTRMANWMPDVSRADLASMADQVRRTATNGGSSMMGAFERVVDSLSTIDPKTTLAPTLEKAATWMGSMMSGMRGK